MLGYQGKWLSVENTKALDNEKNANLLLKGSMAFLEEREKERRKECGEKFRRVSEFRTPSPLYTPRLLYFNYGNPYSFLTCAITWTLK